MVEFTKYSNSIEQVIDDKLATNYPENYGFVVYVRNPNEKSIDFDKLRARYSTQNRLIWVVARMDATATNGDELWMVQSLTKPFVLRIIKKDYSINPNISAILTIAGRGRDNSYEYVPVENVRILLPD
jgi:hypothetical protein